MTCLRHTHNKNKVCDCWAVTPRLPSLWPAQGHGCSQTHRDSQIYSVWQSHFVKQQYRMSQMLTSSKCKWSNPKIYGIILLLTFDSPTEDWMWLLVASHWGPWLCAAPLESLFLHSDNSETPRQDCGTSWVPAAVTGMAISLHELLTFFLCPCALAWKRSHEEPRFCSRPQKHMWGVGGHSSCPYAQTTAALRYLPSMFFVDMFL